MGGRHCVADRGCDMKDLRHIIAKLYNRRGHLGERGIAAVELAIVLPLMLIIVFAIVDFGRLFNARLSITNLAREGGSIASRTSLISPDKTAADIIAMLQQGITSDLGGFATSGKIYVWRIKGGKEAAPNPDIDTSVSASSPGGLSVPSSIGSKLTNLGLSPTFYQHLVYKTANKMSDISSVTVVEVFYKYTPISPISNLIPGLMTSDSGGKIISSKAVF